MAILNPINGRFGLWDSGLVYASNIYTVIFRSLKWIFGFWPCTSAGAGLPKLLLTKENCPKEMLTRGRQF